MSAVLMARAHPLIVDVDRENWIVSPATFDEALGTTGAKAAMLVAPFGIRPDFHEHAEICRKHGALLLLDNAAGLGSAREITGNGTGIHEIYSLHVTKPFAVGEGGLIFAQRDQEDRLRAALNFALRSRAWPDGPRWGINGKMSEIHAAIGLAQLHRFQSFLSKRRHFAECYIEHLAPFSTLRFPRDSMRAPWQLFPVVLPSPKHAERFVERAAARGMEILRYYRPSLADWPHVTLAHPCPNAEWLSERMCCLPIYGDASTDEHDEIIAIVCRSLQEGLDC